jgi:hypothetical protein
MKNENPRKFSSWISTISDLQYIGILFKTWELGGKLLGRLLNEGIYEVLEYESTLELLDKRGEKATFKKRERVRYLQDNIIAYQDQAWGDGDILLDYRCSPGIPVDQYRPGYTTYILISLREVKNRGDIDEFNIEWNIRNGFTRKNELWETSINHPTNKLKTNLIFPRNRPPIKLYVNDGNKNKQKYLDKNEKHQLPDGRWLISWEVNQPIKYKNYVLNWKW